MLDYASLSGNASSYTFTNGATYFFSSSFSVGWDTATFEPGCVVKYGSNAYLLVYGPVSFPSTQQTPVFT